MYDVIIIGTRAAGATTAMLLARAGVRVLAVDRASFPSDTLSTNNIQLPGVARLARWGLLGPIAAAGTPAIGHVRFDPGPVVLEGTYPAFDGVEAVYGPRRTLLDTLLVEAAREAGAEVRERFVVDELSVSDGRVTGIRGRSHGGGDVREQARLVVGADGKHSLVAKTVEAASYEERRPLSLGYFGYWQGVPLEGGEIYGRGRRLIGAWPTNDGLVMTYVAWPAAEFHAFRRDLDRNLLATLDLAGDLGERCRGGRRVERIYGSADLPNFFRKPYGPGWALVGDAGLAIDPITALGINDALRDAELLAAAIVARPRRLRAARAGARRLPARARPLRASHVPVHARARGDGSTPARAGGALPRARGSPAEDRPLPRRPRLRRLTNRLLLRRQPPPPDRPARHPHDRARQDAPQQGGPAGRRRRRGERDSRGHGLTPARDRRGRFV